MKIGSPNNIDVLLHFHLSPTRHERDEAPAVVDAIRTFVLLGALAPDVENGFMRYKTTPMGAAWVQALCNVEAPRAAWLDAQGNILG